MYELAFFALKVLLACAIPLLLLLYVIASINKHRGYSPHTEEGSVVLYDLNEDYDQLDLTLGETLLSKKELRQKRKLLKKHAKEKEKESGEQARLFVLHFKGDDEASEAEGLAELVNALLLAGKEDDEVVLVLDSEGGYVHRYGFATSQLLRLQEAGFHLTVCVDNVAASGGYMMACVGDHIMATPFAILGSIGVYAGMLNIHHLLKKHDIEFEEHTAGQYKRTITPLGENTPEKRAKFEEEMRITHDLFKNFVHQQRPQLEMDTIATGECWYGQEALDKKLIDALGTSEDYLLHKYKEGYAVYKLAYEEPVHWVDKLKEKFNLSVKTLAAQLLRPSSLGQKL